MFGNRKKSLKAKSGQYGGCESNLKAIVLAWWNSTFFFAKWGHFNNN
jgi:hypothetical protein